MFRYNTSRTFWSPLLAHEKEPSSQPQNSPEPSGLLQTLAAAFSGVLFGWFLSKIAAPSDAPSENDRESVEPQYKPRPDENLGRGQAQPVSPIPPSPRQQYQPNRGKDDAPQWKKKTEIAAVCIAGGLLIANIFVTWGTWKAANAAADANNANREALEIVQRPFIVVGGLPFHRVWTPLPNRQTLKEISFEAVLTNTGNTPAVEMVHFFNILPGQQQELAEDQFLGTRNDYRKDFLGPKAGYPIGPVKVTEDYLFSGQPLQDNPKLVKPMGKKLPTPLFFGWAVYKDGFAKAKVHVTEFCRELTGVNLVQKPVGPADLNFQFISCVSHNCTDEYCPDYDQITKFAY